MESGSAASKGSHTVTTAVRVGWPPRYAIAICLDIEAGRGNGAGRLQRQRISHNREFSGRTNAHVRDARYYFYEFLSDASTLQLIAKLIAIGLRCSTILRDRAFAHASCYR